MNLQALSEQLGCPIQNAPHITGVSIDSRKSGTGHLFVALRGENFDGHDFIDEAKARGAVAVLCERPVAQKDMTALIVPDTLAALAQMATFHRQTLLCPVIALTGSNGKTSVKEMIASILPKPAFATQGNLNNHIGVPLSVLSVNRGHRYAVFELGANHRGEIAFTANIVKPHVALINNIAPAHIGEFGSITEVANTKGEIYQHLEHDGTAVINDDDDYAHHWDALLIHKKTIRFSLHKKTDVYASEITFNGEGFSSFKLHLPSGEYDVQLQVPGEHSIMNALAASACCYAADINPSDIVHGLKEFKGVNGRLTYKQGKNKAVIIDDSYNANLRSVFAAVEVLAKRNGRRILVLGDLAELGEWKENHHKEIGLKAKQSGIDYLYTFGEYSAFASQAFGEYAKHFKSKEELARDLLSYLDKDTTVLVKGSRSAGMEKIVSELIG